MVLTLGLRLSGLRCPKCMELKLPCKGSAFWYVNVFCSGYQTSSHMRLELYLWRYNSLKPTDEENDIFNGGLPGLSINM
ncbi:hypothetical protein Lal_00011181 [Lupinus albus]|nr:hypothetical protein Lal_00011181 [Lupinus albus]